MKRFIILLAAVLAACGGGNDAPAPQAAPTPPPATATPTQPVQDAEVWARSAAPVLVPSQPWEYSPGSVQGFVGEPSVIYDVATGVYTMWYSGGWERCSTGTATSTDGITWVKNPANPIMGQGKLGQTIACRNFVVKHDGEVYVYFSNSTGDVPGTIYVTHSADGMNNLATPIPFMTPGTIDKNLANSWMIFNGTKWKFFYDSMTEAPLNLWETFSATCDSPLGPCTKDPGPLKGLQIGMGVYGGGWVQMQNGRYNTYFLASVQGHLQTPIYHACDAGVGTVTFGNHGNYVVTMQPGQDQTGDPFLIDGVNMPDQQSRMWMTDVYNPTGHATIGMATKQGPLSDINCPF